MPIFKKKIKVLCLLSIFLIAVFLFLSFGSCKFSTIERIEETRDMWGSYMTITVFSDEETGNEAINAAFERIKEIGDVASIYDENSEASFLNKNGYLDDPSPDFLNLINSSIDYYNITGGCFDITVQPLLDLWSVGELWKESPEVQAQRVEETFPVIGSDKIIVSDDRIEFSVDGMVITLNGITQGYAVDEAMKIIKGFGIKQALVNISGDLYAMGIKPDGEKWTVELENPDKSGSADTDIEPLPTFVFADKAVTTSGNYYRYYDPEGEVGHIMDPRTGYSANACISATVIADTCIEADALATSVFVLGPEDGMDLVESLDGVEALIIDSERNIYESSGLSEYIK
ncbi:MAG TPA: FAD:protein FMN transferase [Candidatus Humimicrobiaceae bacterium]